MVIAIVFLSCWYFLWQLYVLWMNRLIFCEVLFNIWKNMNLTEYIKIMMVCYVSSEKCTLITLVTPICLYFLAFKLCLIYSFVTFIYGTPFKLKSYREPWNVIYHLHWTLWSDLNSPGTPISLYSKTTDMPQFAPTREIWLVMITRISAVVK